MKYVIKGILECEIEDILKIKKQLNSNGFNFFGAIIESDFDDEEENEFI